jgi:hypothetical protein
MCRVAAFMKKITARHKFSDLWEGKCKISIFLNAYIFLHTYFGNKMSKNGQAKKERMTRQKKNDQAKKE